MQECVLDKRDMQQEVNIEADFNFIFNTYYKKVFNYYYYRTNNKSVAEDLTSGTFEKILCKSEQYDSTKASLEIWIFAIARNTLKDYFKMMKRHPWESIEEIVDSISSEQSPEEKALHSEEEQELIEAIMNLGQRERTIVAYRYGAELKNKEIAQLMGISEKTISKISMRVLKKLRCVLKEGRDYE